MANRPDRPWSRVAAAPITVLLAVFAPSPLLAGDWYVDDDGDCANADGSEANPFCLIQDAIDAALDGDTIHVAEGTYLENLVIGEDLSLVGAGLEVTVVDGMALDRVVHALTGSTVGLDGFTLRNGRASSGGGLQVDSDATVVLSHSRICENTATDRSGGGIFSLGNLRVNHCLICRNSATPGGGGISNQGIAEVAHSLVSENRAEGFAGGIVCAGGRSVFLGLSHSTVARNTARDASGGLHISVGMITVDHVIVAENASPVAPDCGGNELTSEGYTLIGDTSDCTIGGDETGNLYDLSPLFLDPDNGDFFLQPTSPCVDAGNPASFPAGLDLAGNPRLLDGDLDRTMVLDMGAYEFGNVHLEITGDATPGGTLTFETTGKAGMITLLFVGIAPGEVLLRPYGALFLDTNQPHLFFPFAVIPDTKDLVVPPGVTGPLDLVLQEIAIGLHSRNGNFSNAVALTIE